MATARLSHTLRGLQRCGVAADVLPATMRALIKEGDVVNVDIRLRQQSLPSG